MKIRLNEKSYTMYLISFLCFVIDRHFCYPYKNALWDLFTLFDHKYTSYLSNGNCSNWIVPLPIHSILLYRSIPSLPFPS